MLTSKATLELTSRLLGAVRREDAEIITANLLAIFVLTVTNWMLPLGYLVEKFLGDRPARVFAIIIRLLMIIFGLNLVGAALRVVKRMKKLMEPGVEEKAASGKTQGGRRMIVRDEVVMVDGERGQKIVAAPSYSMLNLHPSGLGMRTMSQADGLGENGGGGGLVKERCLLNVPGNLLASLDASKRLSGWTEKLIQNLKQTEKPLARRETDRVPPVACEGGKVSEKKAAKKAIRVLNPEETISELGLGLCLDEMVENVRGWMSRMILKPLTRDIEEIVEVFGREGLDHLNPHHPASFNSALFGGGATSAPIMKSVISITPTNVSQPQSLMDLAQRMKDDPVVQKRLRVEKYLSFCNLASRRSAVIDRIKALSLGPLMAAFHPGKEGADSDTEILLSLFITFMDEKMPSSDFYDAHSFSGKHFCRTGEKHSDRPDALQLLQSGPQHFDLLADSLIFTSHPGPGSLFHAIVFLVEYVMGRRDGFLGMANIKSRAIDLASISTL